MQSCVLLLPIMANRFDRPPVVIGYVVIGYVVVVTWSVVTWVSCRGLRGSCAVIAHAHS